MYIKTTYRSIDEKMRSNSSRMMDKDQFWSTKGNRGDIMYYLFLNAVWYQKKTYFQVEATQLLEVNAIGTDGSFAKEQHWNRRIRPKHLELIPDNTLNYLNEEREKLEHGSQENQVLRELVEMIQENTVLVVWKRRIYDVLLHAMEHMGIRMPLHQLTVVQEVLATVDSAAKNRNLSFDKELRRYHVKYEPEYLHSSPIMASYLKKLYCSAKYTYKRACECNPDRRPILCKQSAKVHSKDCPYVRENLKEEQQTFLGIRNVWEGAEFCKHCARMGLLVIVPEVIEFVKVEKEVSVERYVQNLCKHLHLNCTCAAGVIFVRSRYASWRIYHNGGSVEGVYHENYRHRPGVEHKRNLKFQEGFHQQQLEIRSLQEILWYIANHDKKFLDREICSQK